MPSLDRTSSFKLQEEKKRSRRGLSYWDMTNNASSMLSSSVSSPSGSDTSSSKGPTGIVID